MQEKINSKVDTAAIDAELDDRLYRIYDKIEDALRHFNMVNEL